MLSVHLCSPVDRSLFETTDSQSRLVQAGRMKFRVWQNVCCVPQTYLWSLLVNHDSFCPISYVFPQTWVLTFALPPAKGHVFFWVFMDKLLAERLTWRWYAWSRYSGWINWNILNNGLYINIWDQLFLKLQFFQKFEFHLASQTNKIRKNGSKILNASVSKLYVTILDWRIRKKKLNRACMFKRPEGESFRHPNKYGNIIVCYKGAMH